MKIHVWIMDEAMADISSPIETSEERLPPWLRRDTRESPFGPQTKTHLIKKGAADPRVFELIRRLEEKNATRNGEGTLEWDWARRVCLGGAGLFRELHQKFKNPEDAQDMLWLAAYTSDYSYAHFFVEYANRQGKGDFSKEEHLQYAEAMRAIVPIIAEVQPKVAISFAPQIAYALTHVFHKKMPLKIPTSSSREHTPTLCWNKTASIAKSPTFRGNFMCFSIPASLSMRRRRQRWRKSAWLVYERR